LEKKIKIFRWIVLKFRPYTIALLTLRINSTKPQFKMTNVAVGTRIGEK